MVGCYSRLSAIFWSHEPQADALLHENLFLFLEGCNIRANASEEPQVEGRRRDWRDGSMAGIKRDKTEQDREEE